jgi:hypothetical protein
MIWSHLKLQLELLFQKLASAELGLLNRSSSLDAALGVTKFKMAVALNGETLRCAA